MGQTYASILEFESPDVSSQSRGCEGNWYSSSVGMDSILMGAKWCGAEPWTNSELQVGAFSKILSFDVFGTGGAFQSS